MIKGEKSVLYIARDSIKRKEVENSCNQKIYKKL